MRLFIIILVAFLFGPIPSYGQQHQSSNDVGTNNQNSPANHEEQSVTPSASEQSRSVDNYAAQEAQAALSQAASNRTIVYITFALFIVAIVQAVVYGFQCRLMKQSIEQNAKSSQIELRPYISITDIEFPMLIEGEKDDFEYRGELRFKNDGKTPAYGVITHVFWDSISGSDLDLHLPAGYKFPELDSIDPKLLIRCGSAYTVASGQPSSTFSGFLPKPHGFSFQNAVDKFIRDEITIFIFAKVTYRDVFQDPDHPPHVTRRCWRLIKDGKDETSLVTYDLFNDAT